MADILIFPDRFNASTKQVVTAADEVQRRLDTEGDMIVDYIVHLVHTLVYEDKIIHVAEQLAPGEEVAWGLDNE